PVVHTATLPPAVHQARLLQRGEVLRHGRLRDVEARREILYRRFTPRERLEDRPAAGVRQRPEHPVLDRDRVLHGPWISVRLWIVKRSCPVARSRPEPCPCSIARVRT